MPPDYGLDLPAHRKVEDGRMEIMLLYVADCPNLALARERVREAATKVGLVVRVEERLVSDSAEAAELGFTGSPTILIDGTDPFATVDTKPSVACRLYATGEGVQGAPSVNDLVRVLRR